MLSSKEHRDGEIKNGSYALFLVSLIFVYKYHIRPSFPLVAQIVLSVPAVNMSLMIVEAYMCLRGYVCTKTLIVLENTY